jgi:hypothetical protein
VGGKRHASAALPLGKRSCIHFTEVWVGPGPVWTGAENLASTGIRSPDRLARSIRMYHIQWLKKVLVYITKHTLLDGVLREGARGESRCADGRTTKVSTNHHPHKSQQWLIPIPSSYFRHLFNFYYQTIKTPQQRRIYSVTIHSTAKRRAIYCTALSERIISNEMRPPTDLCANTNKTQGTVQTFLNS